jgi:hypothetical protein
MAIKEILRGFGNGAGDIVRFTNGNTAQMTYPVGEDGGPTGPSGVTYIPPSGGIVDTTGVVLMAAPGAGKTNTLTRMTVTNAGTATEIELRNGASGPVLWRGFAPANSTQDFFPNVTASANALIEFAAITTAAKIYVTNISGYVS